MSVEIIIANNIINVNVTEKQALGAKAIHIYNDERIQALGKKLKTNTMISFKPVGGNPAIRTFDAYVNMLQDKKTAIYDDYQKLMGQTGPKTVGQTGPKTVKKAVAKKVPIEEEVDIEIKPKKAVGRPKKVVDEATSVTPVKKTVGRPKKVVDEAAPVKKTVGRPKKVAKNEEEEEEIEI